MNSSSLYENGPVRLKACRHGAALYLVTDQYVGQSLDRYGEFSEGEADLLRQAIQPGWTILEVGANMGAHTVFLSKAAGPAGAVLAFEPQRVLFQILCANVVLNSMSNVVPHNLAVGRESTAIMVPRLESAVTQNFGRLSLCDTSQRDQSRGLASDEVRVDTIDSLNLAACHLIKVDVEGMEGDVIAGADRTIRKFKPTLYLENDRPDKSATLIRQLLELDYRLYWHLPPLFNPSNYFGTTENIFPDLVSFNMLGIHASQRQNLVGFKEIIKPEDSWQA